MRSRLCLYVVGAPPPELEVTLGNYEAWFRRLLSPHPLEVVSVDGTAPTALDPRDFAGVLITGSPASLTAPEPWMDAAVELVQRSVAAGTPLLGVCFGLQLIGVAAGGRVIPNPRGWEFGTHEVALTEEGARDPLFAGLPQRIEVNHVHRDVVDPDSLPAAAGVRALATSFKSPLQAIALGDAVRGIQFHPEIDRRIAAAYLAARRAELEADAETRGAPEDHPDQLSARDTAASEQVLANWVRHFVL